MIPAGGTTRRRSRLTVARRIGDTVRGAMPALVCYYATTLGIPIVRGAAAGAGPLSEHAAFVLVVPILLLAVVGVIRALIRA